MTPQKGDRVLAWDDDRSKAVEGVYVQPLDAAAFRHVVRLKLAVSSRCGYFKNVKPIKLKPISVLHKGKAILVCRKDEVDAILNQRGEYERRSN